MLLSPHLNFSASCRFTAVMAPRWFLGSTTSTRYESKAVRRSTENRPACGQPPRSAEELADYAIEIVDGLMSLDDDERGESYRLTLNV